MKLVDLKLPKKSKEELQGMTAPVEKEQDKWPYGMQLRFDSEQVNKIPEMKEMGFGEKVHIMGEGEITEFSMREDQGGEKKYSITVQLKQVGIENRKASHQESMSDAMGRVRKTRTM